MKDNDEFLKKMEDLQVPEINPTGHPKMVKMAILNAERSAALGVWLIVVPCYFLLCVFMYYFFHVRLSIFVSMFNLMSSLDKTPYIGFLSPLLLVGLPIVSVIINMLSIMNVQYRRLDPNMPGAKEINISIRLRFWNILLILVSLAIVCIFVCYAIAENITVR